MGNTKYIYVTLSLILVALAAGFSLPSMARYFDDAGHDGQWYIAIAEGRIGEVVQPFSGRILYPYLVSFIDKISPLSLSQSFFWLAIVSLFLFFIINFSILKGFIRSPLQTIPLFFLPYFFIVSREFLLPDVFYIFLISLFFFLLFHKKEGASLMVLFLLFLTRETTIVLGLVLLATSLFRSKKIFFWGTLAVIVISVFTTSGINQLGLSNPHDLGNVPYIIAKIFYNFLNNVLGLQLWVNTLASNCEPVFTSHLPQLSIFGSIREVGFCGFNLYMPSITILALLTTFGILPLALFSQLFKRFRDFFNNTPFWLLTALVTGILFYILGVPAGTGVERIVGYGFPAFLLVTPFIIQKFFILDKDLVFKLSITHLLVAWLPFLVWQVFGYVPYINLVLIFIIVLAYLYSWKILRSRAVDSSPNPLSFP